LCDLAKVGAVAAHHGDTGTSSFVLEHAGDAILSWASGQVADAEVGYVKQALLLPRLVAQ
jgi:hypothetical protein